MLPFLALRSCGFNVPLQLPPACDILNLIRGGSRWALRASIRQWHDRRHTRGHSELAGGAECCAGQGCHHGRVQGVIDRRPALHALQIRRASDRALCVDAYSHSLPPSTRMWTRLSEAWSVGVARSVCTHVYTHSCVCVHTLIQYAIPRYPVDRILNLVSQATVINRI